jgi:3-phosphoshikimate 1-carboxyvinyltransferase
MKIKVSQSALQGAVSVPGSKSHTIRAIIAALLAEGKSYIRNPLVSDDTESALYAARKLGAKFEDSLDNDVLVWEITGTGGNLSNPNDEIIYLGNSGTSLRLLTGAVATTDLKICFDGDSSLRGRPMGPLISAMSKLGAKITFSEGGKCPLTVKGPLRGGQTIVEGKSSQFVSALLFAAPFAKKDTEIHVIKLNEKSYIDVTVDWLKFLNIDFTYEPDYSKFVVKGGQKYKHFSKNIPADFSTAAFPLVASAITKSPISIKNLDFEDKQGDKELFDILEKMGMRIERFSDEINIRKTGILIGDREINMNNIPDALPIMAVTACFAKGKTILNKAPHVRIKETDRIAAMAKELKKMGAKIEELNDGLVIEGTKLHSAIVNGHGDHRIIMSLCIAGMALDGETIVENAGGFSVTYPGFIRDFKKLGANIEKI